MRVAIGVLTFASALACASPAAAQSADEAKAAFERYQKLRTSIETASPAERGELLKELGEVATGYLDANAAHGSAKELREVLGIWILLNKRDAKAIQARWKALNKAKKDLPEGFAATLEAHAAWKKTEAKLKKAQAKKKEGWPEMHDAAAAYLGAHAFTGVEFEVTTSFRVWNSLSAHLDRDKTELMTKLAAKLDQLPKRVQQDVSAWKKALRPGMQAPAWSAVKLTDGKAVTLADYKGKLVLLDFWASWCAPCIKLMKERLVPLHAKFGARDDFAVVSVGLPARKDTMEKQKAAAKKIGTKWEKVFCADGAKEYAIQALPYLVLLDGEGKVLVAGSGNAVIDRVEAAINERLAKQ